MVKDQLETAVVGKNWTPLQLLASQSFLAGFSLALLYSVSNSRFLLDFSADWLPQAYIVAAAVVPAISFLYNRYAQQVAERRLLLTVTLIICGIYLFCWLAAFWGGWRWISFALLVIFNVLFVFQVVIITQQASRLFDIRQMKTAYPLVLASQTGAVIVGGLSISLLTTLLGSVENLLFAALLLSFLQFCMTWLTMNSHPAQFSQRGDKQETATLRDVLASPYAGHIFFYRFFSGFGTELIIVLFIIQAERRFQTAESLATFFGNIMAGGTFLTLLFLLLVAGWLLKRFGLRFGIMCNPLLVSALILALFVVQVSGASLGSAVFVLVVASRILDFILSVSMTEPSMKTMYQALPEQSRAAIITVVEAVSIPFGYGIVGLSLLLFQLVGLDGDTFLVSFTFVVCVIWTLLGWRTYRLYASTLLEKLNRPIYGPVDIEIDDPETAAIVQKLTHSNNLTQVRLGLNLLEQAEHPSYPATLRTLAKRDHEPIQVEAFQRLEQQAGETATFPFQPYLHPPTPSPIQSAALQAYLATGEPAAVALASQTLLSADGSLRQAALVGLLRHGGLAGHVAAGEQLLALSESEREEDKLLLAHVLGALETHNLQQFLEKLLDSPFAAVRAAALQATANVQSSSLLPKIVAQLASTQTRALAAEALRGYGVEILPFVTAVLQNEATPLPQTLALVRLAGQLPDETAVSALQPHLLHPHPDVRLAVLAALQQSQFRAEEAAARAQVEAAIAHEVETAGRLLTITAALEETEPLAWLQAALKTERQRGTSRLLRLFAFLYDSQRLRRVEDYLRFGTAAQVAQVTETIDLLFAPDHKRSLLPLIDPSLSPAQRLSALKKQVALPEEADWLAAIIENKNGRFSDWTRACAIYGAALTDGSAYRKAIGLVVQADKLTEDDAISRETAVWALNHPHGEQDMLTIEKVSFLKQTDLFSNVPERVLAAVAQILEVVRLPSGKQFINEGEPAREMYIIVEGKVRVQKGGKTIVELQAGETVGELAIFDQEPRAADVVALEPTMLLQLDKDTFREVMADRPEISQGIIQVLSQRIRRQGEQMAKV